MNARNALLLAALVSVSACAPNTDLPESSEETSNDEARALDADIVYQVTGRDFRKCAYPLCSGYFVKAVNKTKTTCADGTKQAECYVADLDLSALELPATQTEELLSKAIAGDVLLSGNIQIESHGQGGLHAYKAFESRTGADFSGPVYLVENSGIVCITTPCPSIQGRKLNSTVVKPLTDLDFSALGLSADEAAAAANTVATTGLVISGSISTKGQKKTLKASQIFDTVQAEAELCLNDAACGEGAYCDMTECLSNCAPDMVCPAVCYGACTPGEEPEPTGASCVDACGGAAADESCYCDDACDYYGDCCSDYVSECL